MDVASKVKCLICQKEFTNKKSLNNHKIKIHERRYQVKCYHCNTLYTDKATLDHHILLVHEKTLQVKCNICSHTYCDQNSLKLHKEMVHEKKLSQARQLTKLRNQKSIKCEICKNNFKGRYVLQKHIERKHSKKSIQCQSCTSNFASQILLNDHIRRKHNVATFDCDFEDCNAKFNNKINLNRHKSLHNQNYDYKCTQCASAYKSKESLYRHITIIHEKKQVQICPITWCEKESLTLNAHKTHMKIHLPENTIKQHRQEYAFQLFLDSKHIDYKRELRVEGDCIQTVQKFYKLDFVVMLRGIVFVIEIDEDQHKGYSIRCESERPIRICQSMFQSQNSLPIKYIHLNPNSYDVNGKSIRKYKIDRYESILNLLQKQDHNKNPLEVFYCYYDIEDGRLAISKHDDFCKEILDVMAEPIY